MGEGCCSSHVSYNFLQTTVFPRLVSDVEQKLSLRGLRLAVEAWAGHSGGIKTPGKSYQIIAHNGHPHKKWLCKYV